MMLVGVIVAGLRPSELIKGWRMYAFIIFRQLLVPIVAIFVLQQFSPDKTSLNVFAVMAAMPVGSMAPMLETEFGYTSPIVAKTTVSSTVISFAIIPLLLLIIS